VDVLQTQRVIGVLQVDDETLQCITDDRCVVAARVLSCALGRLLVECDDRVDGAAWQASLSHRPPSCLNGTRD
jgi:hypothetical protein